MVRISDLVKRGEVGVCPLPKEVSLTTALILSFVGSLIASLAVVYADKQGWLYPPPTQLQTTQPTEPAPIYSAETT